MEESICFPLPPLVAVVLERIREEQLEEAILVVPWWTNKYWFRVLKTMIQSVRRLRLQEDLVVDLMTGLLLRLKDLKLVVCSDSGRSKEIYCWTQLENVSWRHGDQGPGTGMEECCRATGIGCDVVEFGQLQIL